MSGNNSNEQLSSPAAQSLQSGQSVMSSITTTTMETTGCASVDDNESTINDDDEHTTIWEGFNDEGIPLKHPYTKIKKM